MPNANYILLHVADPEASGRFYAPLLGLKPVVSSPTFTLFKLPSGLSLGLWLRDDVQPASTAPAGASELGFQVETAAEVDATFEAWRAAGAPVAMPPTDLVFGRNGVVVDPDGHRLRVYNVAN